MVRAAVSARQASLERSGSAPAPCPQAEPRPDAEKRRREAQRNAGGTCAGGACAGHVCKVARARVQGCSGGGGGVRVHASDRRQTCVCAWRGVVQGGLRAACVHAEVDFCLPGTEGEGDKQRTSVSSSLSHEAGPPNTICGRPCSGSEVQGDSVQHASNNEGCEGPNHRGGRPGLLRLFRAACDSSSSTDVTRSIWVSMYGTTCAQRAKRTLRTWLFGPHIESRAGTCAARSQIEDQKELGVLGMSVSHRLFDSKHWLSKPKPAGCSTAAPCPAATSSVDRANAHALLLPRQLVRVVTELRCAHCALHFLHGTHGDD